MILSAKNLKNYSKLSSECSSLPSEWTVHRGLTVDKNLTTLPKLSGHSVCLSCSDENMILVGDACYVCNVYMPGNFYITSEPSCEPQGTVFFR